ncbi:hypothetical protein BGZ83_004981 [Gryganskiella cystojenkinii]|nr:hypothetical protein BGZ83_004981 [Gryganskiella cystojenkinii]
MEGEEKERNIDQDINCSPKEAVVGVAAVADAMSDSVIEGSLVESVEKETVEEKADEKKEELVDVESQSPSEEKSEVVKIDPLAVATAEATTAATTAFVLMEAVDPETHSRIASSSTLAEEEEEQEEEEQVQEPRPSMQIVTTSPVVHYAQVPSPPLTPLGLSSKDAETEETPTGMLSPQSEDGDGKMGSKELLTAASFTGTMLTPRAETSPFTRISDEEESRRSSEESATIDEIQEKQEPQSQYVLQRRTTVEQEEKKYETFDVLNDHSSFKSSESSSSLWSAVGSTVDSQASQEEHGRRPRELPEPDKYPNLLWSFCKTTAVVSAAVVVIGLGLGRKRD